MVALEPRLKFYPQTFVNKMLQKFEPSGVITYPKFYVFLILFAIW